MAALITGFLGRIKSDKGLLIRVIVGTILTITTLGLGFGLLVRTAVYSHHHKKFALEAIGFSDPNFTEQFPQFTICPGWQNHTGTPTQGIITGVHCTFHDIQPADPHQSRDSTDKKETKSSVTYTGPVSHIIDFRKYDNCYDINNKRENSPTIKWIESHSYIGCSVHTNSYVHLQAYGFDRTRPSHVMSHYNSLRNMEATLVSVRAEEISGWAGTFYEIDRVDEEMRFHGARDHLYFTIGFSRFEKRRYQEFHSAHQQADVMIGTIGGFGLLFFMLYKLVSVVTTMIFGDTSNRVAYEAQQ